MGCTFRDEDGRWQRDTGLWCDCPLEYLAREKLLQNLPRFDRLLLRAAVHALHRDGTSPMPRPRAPRLSAPYLRRVVLDGSRIEDGTAFPFCLPIFQKGFDLEFDRVVTILIGEDGVGKSTILEGIAAVAGYDDAGKTGRAVALARAGET